MGQWFKRTRYKREHQGFVYEYDTASELGLMVAQSGSEMPNPYEHHTQDYVDFNKARDGELDRVMQESILMANINSIIMKNKHGR